MLVKLGSSSPIFGVKIKHVRNHHLDNIAPVGSFFPLFKRKLHCKSIVQIGWPQILFSLLLFSILPNWRKRHPLHGHSSSMMASTEFTWTANGQTGPPFENRETMFSLKREQNFLHIWNLSTLTNDMLLSFHFCSFIPLFFPVSISWNKGFTTVVIHSSDSRWLKPQVVIVWPNFTRLH